MNERKWTLRIIDAKARIRAWSKRKLLYSLLVAGLVATVSAPGAALAEEVPGATLPQVAEEQVVQGAAVADSAVPGESSAKASGGASQSSSASGSSAADSITAGPAATSSTNAGSVSAGLAAAVVSAPADTVATGQTATVADSGVTGSQGSAAGMKAGVSNGQESTGIDDATIADVTGEASTDTATAVVGSSADASLQVLGGGAVPNASAISNAAADAVTDVQADAGGTTPVEDQASARATDITFTRIDDNYTEGADPKISMTEERAFQVTVGVEGVDQPTLQDMLDRDEVRFWLKRDHGIMDEEDYPYQYLGGELKDWKTVPTQYAEEKSFFTNVSAQAVTGDGNTSIVLTFGNNLLFGVNGIDNRARALVRSAMLDYVGAYQLICDLGNGSSVGTVVELRPYDEYHTQAEIDEALPKLEEEARENGIYAKVVSFGTSAEGRDMKAIFVAESEQDLEDYQALKTQMEADPAAVLAQLEAGNLSYKVPVFYSNVHADEVVAVDGVMQFLKDLVACEPIEYNRLTGLTEAGEEELKTEMDADGTVWSDLIKDKATGVGYIRGNGGNGNGVSQKDSRSKSGLNDASSDLTDEEFALYYTIAQQTFDPKEILKHVFFILVPSENVDARTSNLRTNGNGFDLNRDNTYQTQPETQAMSALITQWDPISLHEVHGYYQQFQIEPCSPTHDPNNEYDLFIDTALAEGEYFASTAVANNRTINSAQIPLRDYLKSNESSETGVSWSNDYYSYPFDDMSTSYTPQYAMMHGANAFTVEVPVGTSDAVHALEYGFIGNAQFVINNKDTMFANLLKRYLRGIENIDADTIRPYYVSEQDEAGAEADTFRPRDAKDANGETNDNFFPEYYVIPMDAEAQEDRAAAIESVKFLLHNGVKVSRLTQDTTVGSRSYKAGTIVVDMRQAKRNMANCALYPNLVIDDWAAYSLYSEPVTNFSAFRGYDMDTIRRVGAFDGMLEEITQAPTAQTVVHGEGPVSIIRNDSIEAVRAVNDLLGQGVKVGLITSSEHEGDYVVATADLAKASGSHILYVTQGSETPEAQQLRNDIKVYVPVRAGEFITDADGNPHGLRNYTNRLNTNGNWDTFALWQQMGFTLTDDLDEATIIVGSQYPTNASDVAAKILAGTPYVGYTSNATSFAVASGLIDSDGFEWQRSYGGFDALDTVVFPEDDIVTATYRIEDDYIMYGYGGSYFVSVPEGAKVLIRTTDDRPIEGFMSKEFIEQYKGKIQAIKILDGDKKMILFANTLTNKAHQQDDYRYLTASIYSLSYAGDFPAIPAKSAAEREAVAEVPAAPDARYIASLNPEGGNPRKAAEVEQHAWEASLGSKAAGTAGLPQTGDKSTGAAGVAVLAGGVLAAGVATRRRSQRES